MLIDFHTYVGKSMLGQESTEQELLENMEKNQISVSVVCPVKTIDPNLGKDSEKILTEAVMELGLKGLILHSWQRNFRM